MDYLINLPFMASVLTVRGSWRVSLSLALHCLVIDKKDPGGAQNKTLETLLQCFKFSFFH